jgi:hypothetical protein
VGKKGKVVPVSKHSAGTIHRSGGKVSLSPDLNTGWTSASCSNHVILGKGRQNTMTTRKISVVVGGGNQISAIQPIQFTKLSQSIEKQTSISFFLYYTQSQGEIFLWYN